MCDGIQSGLFRITHMAVLLVMCYAMSFGATENTTGSEGGIIAPQTDTPRFHAQLRSANTHLLLGEPVWVTFSIQNAGIKDTTMIRSAPPGSDYLNYEIVAPGKQPRTFMPMGVLSGSGRAKRLLLLKPADSFSRADELTYEQRGILIDQPGEYVIHAVYCLPDGVPGGPFTIRSNGICIVVEAPMGDDKTVYDALVERIAKKSKIGGLWTVEAACIPEYEAILAAYPRGGYAVSIHHHLAQAYEFYAKNEKRDAKEVVALVEKAILNYRVVAETLAATPLGTQAYQLAGRSYASLNKVNSAEEMYRAAFCSPGVTSESQLDILSWIKLLEMGTFYGESGLVKPGKDVTTKVMLPLLPYARALGYKMTKDEKTGESVLIKGDYQWIIKPGEDPLLVCGTLCKNMRVELDKDGGFRVSPSVIAMLMAERYGKDMARQLSFMLTRAK